MAKKIFDVIVVGTGAGGGMAMKTLCEAGLNVVALNSGRRLDPVKDFGNHRQREVVERGDLARGDHLARFAGEIDGGKKAVISQSGDLQHGEVV